MKRQALLFCLALMTGPLIATGWAGCASADPHRDRHQQSDDRDGRSNSRYNRDDNSDRDTPVLPTARIYRRDAPVRNDDSQRDDRINRAMAIGRSRGHVLDAGPQGGSVFWVRVDTGHGRVDLLVDADSGRIIGEK